MSRTTYHPALVALHWIMGLSILALLASGFALEFELVPDHLKSTFYGLHKSGGFTMIAAFIVRVGLRFTTHIPAMPYTMPKLDITLAKLGHFALYALMIALPLSGWIMTSAFSSKMGTPVFDLFDWPHLPLAGDKELGKAARMAHKYIAYGLSAVLIAHIGAVAKHATVERINLLRRMWF